MTRQAGSYSYLHLLRPARLYLDQNTMVPSRPLPKRRVRTAFVSVEILGEKKLRLCGQ